jgi:hypothetical protein
VPSIRDGRHARSGCATQDVKTAQPFRNLVPTGENLGHHKSLRNLRDSRASGETLPLACKSGARRARRRGDRNRPALGMIVCACFCITALDKKIVGRWNAIDNFFGAV